MGSCGQYKWQPLFSRSPATWRPLALLTPKKKFSQRGPATEVDQKCNTGARGTRRSQEQLRGWRACHNQASGGEEVAKAKESAFLHPGDELLSAGNAGVTETHLP